MNDSLSPEVKTAEFDSAGAGSNPAASAMSPFLPGTKVQFAEACKLQIYKRPATTANFWNSVKITESGCWISKLACNAKGYVPITRGGRNTKKERLHRVIYELCFGPLSAEAKVLHSCDVRRCINPNHLFSGSDADNTQDMMDKNRGSNQYRESYGRKYGNVG